MKQFNILKEEVNQEVDEKGNFTFFLEAQSSVIVFKEQDLKNLIEDIAKTNLGVDFRIKNYKLEYGAGRADFKQGKISFAVNFQGSFYKPVDIDNFKKQILNKTEGELKSLVYSSSNIEKTMVSFWPFWVKKVPNDLNRIKVEVE